MASSKRRRRLRWKAWQVKEPRAGGSLGSNLDHLDHLDHLDQEALQVRRELWEYSSQEQPGHQSSTVLPRSRIPNGHISLRQGRDPHKSLFTRELPETANCSQVEIN